MTRPELIDPSTKCNLNVEDAGKISLEHAGRILEKNSIAICSAQVVPENALNRDASRVCLDTRPEAMNLAEVKLYDLEPSRIPEKPLKIDLDLYQMEDF